MILTIARHAHANAHGIDGDFSRELSGRGHAQAAESAAFIRSLPIQPDYAIVSSAVRTTQTFEDFTAGCPVEFSQAAYNASLHTLTRLIHEAPEQTKNLLLVAHNPGVTDLAMTCGYDSIMSTGAVVVVEWQGTSEEFGTSPITVLASFTPTH